MTIWQNDIFHNGSKIATSIRVNKKDIVWPVIALTLGKDLPTDYINDYDEGLIAEINQRYSELISNCTEKYDIVTQVLFDYNLENQSLPWKERVSCFVENKWEDYVEILSLNSLPTDIQEGVAKIVLAKIIHQRYRIEKIRKEVSL